MNDILTFLMVTSQAQTSVFCASVLESLTIELRGTKDFSKLNAGIALLGYIASISEPINTGAFSHLLTFLGHRYPKVQKMSISHKLLLLHCTVI